MRNTLKFDLTFPQRSLIQFAIYEWWFEFEIYIEHVFCLICWAHNLMLPAVKANTNIYKVFENKCSQIQIFNKCICKWMFTKRSIHKFVCKLMITNPNIYKCICQWMFSNTNICTCICKLMFTNPNIYKCICKRMFSNTNI